MLNAIITHSIVIRVKQVEICISHFMYYFLNVVLSVKHSAFSVQHFYRILRTTS